MLLPPKTKVTRCQPWEEEAGHVWDWHQPGTASATQLLRQYLAICCGPGISPGAKEIPGMQ